MIDILKFECLKYEFGLKWCIHEVYDAFMKFIFICSYFYHFMIHVSNLKLKYIMLLIYTYTQNFVIIKKEEIIDSIIDFDDYQILSN